MTQHMPGTWKAIDIEIYEVDDLGNPGNFLAMARDQRVAAWMADTHNSMLAALKLAERLHQEGIFALSNDEIVAVHTARQAAIAKAEGTKP